MTTLQDPYQNSLGPHDHPDWFRHQNRGVMARTSCLVCGGSLPESEEFGWKYAQAAGCLEGPFCSPECYWRWLNR